MVFADYSVRNPNGPGRGVGRRQRNSRDAGLVLRQLGLLVLAADDHPDGVDRDLALIEQAVRGGAIKGDRVAGTEFVLLKSNLNRESP